VSLEIEATDILAVNGQIALVMQNEAWKMEVSIAHTNGREVCGSHIFFGSNNVTNSPHFQR
jgi:hypothetical protein